MGRLNRTRNRTVGECTTFNDLMKGGLPRKQELPPALSQIREYLEWLFQWPASSDMLENVSRKDNGEKPNKA